MPEASDPWPTIEETSVALPVTILRQHAGALGPKTGNLVEARVDTRYQGDVVEHRVLLVAPALGHYTYELLTVAHDILRPYPVRLTPPDGESMQVLLAKCIACRLSGADDLPFDGGRDVKVADAEALTQALEVVLGSPRSKEVIESLLVQSRAVA